MWKIGCLKDATDGMNARIHLCVVDDVDFSVSYCCFTEIMLF